MNEVPLCFANGEKAHLKKILECGVIRLSPSQKCGGVDWCISFRVVNEVTKKDSFTLPLIEDCLDVLKRTEFISTLIM